LTESPVKICRSVFSSLTCSRGQCSLRSRESFTRDSLNLTQFALRPPPTRRFSFLPLLKSKNVTPSPPQYFPHKRNKLLCKKLVHRTDPIGSVLVTDPDGVTCVTRPDDGRAVPDETFAMQRRSYRVRRNKTASIHPLHSDRSDTVANTQTFRIRRG
jgi:hypothetical protein